jgi:hypothetical protein
MIQQVCLVGSLEVLVVISILGVLPRKGNFTTSFFQSWTYHRIAILSFSYKEISLSYNHAFCIDYSDY